MSSINAIAGRKRCAALTCVLGAALISACYGYYPIEHAAPLTGRRLHLDLTDSGAFALTSKIGPAATGIEGNLLADSGAVFDLAVLAVEKRNGSGDNWKGERVLIPHILVQQATERRFSPARTALFSFITVAALTSIDRAFHGPGFASLGNGRPGIVPPH